IGSTLKERSQAAPSRVSTTRYEWLPDDPSAFEPIKPWKWPCFTRLEDSPNRSPPTNSAEEAVVHAGPLSAHGNSLWTRSGASDGAYRSGGQFERRQPHRAKQRRQIDALPAEGASHHASH